MPAIRDAHAPNRSSTSDRNTIRSTLGILYYEKTTRGADQLEWERMKREEVSLMSAGSGTVVVYTFQNASPDGRRRDELISGRDKSRSGKPHDHPDTRQHG